MDTNRVLDLVRLTRPMLLPHWGKIDGEKKELGEYSLVTKLDRDIEQYLTDGLKPLAPGVGFAGEESGGSRDQERFWLCDPIDGTLQFVRGLPFCTVQLALIEQGRVTFSVIYDFLNDIMYHATRGEGAFQNGERFHISQREPERAIVIFETRLFDVPENVKLASEISRRFHGMRSLVSGIEFVFVATGKVEARVCFDPWGKDYDYAAGSLLVEEAGGIVANVGSSSYDFRNTNMIAASPAVFHVLTEGPDALLPVVK